MNFRRNAIITEIGTGTYSENHKSVTIADAVRRWLANREGEVKNGSLGAEKSRQAGLNNSNALVTAKQPRGFRPQPGDIQNGRRCVSRLQQSTLRCAPDQFSAARRLVPAEGFEPPTTRLRSGCSTAELRRLKPRH